MPALTTLKPRISTLRTAKAQPLAGTPRTRGSVWMRIRAAVLREHPHCADCMSEGRINLADEIDHIVPLHDGGTDERANLRPLCREHHAAKTAGEAKRRARG